MAPAAAVNTSCMHCVAVPVWSTYVVAAVRRSEISVPLISDICCLPHLAHEAGDHPMESRVLVPKPRLVRCAQLLEVLSCFGYRILLKFHHNASQFGGITIATQLDIKVDQGVGLEAQQADNPIGYDTECRW